MVLGEHHLERVQTRAGTSFRMAVAAVECVADLALLAATDAQVLEEDCDRFESWSETVDGLQLAAVPRADKQIAVHLYTHTQRWVRGTVRRFASSNGVAWVEANAPIRGGTSGGPVVDDTGRLVGVVSNFNEVRRGRCSGMMPVAASALPTWAVKHINLKTGARPAHL